ncbi:trypsin CFT-1-like isoform X4 [Spodoptera litura]|uniref:limulus clotting factor C n=1 Tax=Spodoptera litura TaxID=69820 RepID=A0A9J7DZM6_SPOLT|nr:trypsin CFT-1-like isoform X4 [Spodoptera litura]
MRVLALLALCLAAVSAVPSKSQRIVGGSLANISQYPSIASLLYSWNLSQYWQACGGTILNQRTILTAAHCTHGDAANRWRIRLGSSWANSGGNVYNCASNIVHGSYNSRTLDNDIAILRSSANFIMSNNVRAASVAGANYWPADNQAVWAAGWGDTFEGSNAGSEQLRHVQLVIINQNTCRNNYASRGVAITDNMLCSGWPSGGRDQCQGDSGGPLYHNNVVVGVCSFGIGCAQAAFPGVNARVSRYASWISSNA